MRDYGVARHDTFKFDMMVEISPTGPGGPSASRPAPAFTLDLKLLRKGCVVYSATIFPILPGNSSHILPPPQPPAPTALELDGFSLRLRPADPTGAPAAISAFALLGSSDAGRSWSTAASLSYRLVPSGVRFLPAAQGPAVAAGAAPVRVDYTPPWPLFQASSARDLSDGLPRAQSSGRPPPRTPSSRLHLGTRHRRRRVSRRSVAAPFLASAHTPTPAGTRSPAPAPRAA